MSAFHVSIWYEGPDSVAWDNHVAVIYLKKSADRIEWERS